jgi:hypothetical protein
MSLNPLSSRIRDGSFIDGARMYRTSNQHPPMLKALSFGDFDCEARLNYTMTIKAATFRSNLLIVRRPQEGTHLTRPYPLRSPQSRPMLQSRGVRVDYSLMRPLLIPSACA